MTDTDLIRSLTADFAPVSPASAGRTLATATVVGAAASVALVAATLGVQPVLAGAAAPAFAMKLAYALALAALAFAAALRLGRPGAGAPAPLPFLAPAAALAVLAAATWLARAGAPSAGVMGASWTVCPPRIVGFALPVFVGAVLAMRRQAPTQPRLAGAAAGLLAGAAGAAAYALACPEASPAFVLVWYSAGIAATAGLGAFAGPTLLRWR